MHIHILSICMCVMHVIECVYIIVLVLHYIYIMLLNSRSSYYLASRRFFVFINSVQLFVLICATN